MLPQSNIFVYEKQHARFSQHDSLGNQRALFRTPPVYNCRPQIELTPPHYRFPSGENPSQENKARKIKLSLFSGRQWLATLTGAPDALFTVLKTGHCQ
jgi:hypothetical protein